VNKHKRPVTILMAEDDDDENNRALALVFFSSYFPTCSSRPSRIRSPAPFPATRP
jgi:hypothetical protein